MLRLFVTAAIVAIGTIGFVQAHSDKPKEAAEKKAAHAKSDAGKKAQEKEKDKDKHGGDHGKSGHERKH